METKTDSRVKWTKSKLKYLALFFVVSHPNFKLFEVDSLGVFSEYEVNDFLFEIVLHVLFVESAQTFESMVHHSHQVSLACSCHVGVGWPCACVVFWNCITVVCPHILQVYNKLIWILMVICCFYESRSLENFLNVETTFDQNGVQNIQSYFCLD